MRVNVWRFIVIGGLVVVATAWSANGRVLPLGVHSLHANDSEMQASRDLGAQYIVQVFAWSEIEPTRGEFHWEYTDWLVRAAEYFQLKIVARLDKPPQWATGKNTLYSAPPNRLEDYGDFIARVADRYRGRIAAYIIWNEPNLAREWGDLRPDPIAYTALLRHATLRLRAVDPNALIISAGLAPTNDHNAQALDDREFLRAMYAAGARGAFDVLATHPYPFAHSPDDPRGAHNSLNFQRIQDLRDIMIANGDAAKPIWITEFGYPTTTTTESASLQVSEELQAQWLERAYQIAREQMPFVKMFTAWNLTRATVSPDDQAGYSLLRADGSQKPAYATMQAMPKASVASTVAANVSSLFAAPASASSFPVLARDAVIHLGDAEYDWPWVPLYRAKNPSVEWSGEFYLRDSDLRSAAQGKPWTLMMELMQVNTLNARVLVNDQSVNPPFLPTEDFTSVWVTAQFQVPTRLLQVGRNTITLRAGNTIPAFQQLGSWDDLQIRNVALHKPGLPGAFDR